MTTDYILRTGQLPSEEKSATGCLGFRRAVVRRAGIWGSLSLPIAGQCFRHRDKYCSILFGNLLYSENQELSSNSPGNTVDC